MKKRALRLLLLCLSTGLCADTKKLSDILRQSPEAFIKKVCEEQRAMAGLPPFDEKVYVDSFRRVGDLRLQALKEVKIGITKKEGAFLVIPPLATYLFIQILPEKLFKYEYQVEWNRDHKDTAIGSYRSRYQKIFGLAALAIGIYKSKQLHNQRRRELIMPHLGCSQCLNEIVENGDGEFGIFSSEQARNYAALKAQEFKRLDKLCFNHQKETESEQDEKNNL